MFHVKRFSFNGYYTTFLHFGQEPCILREILSLGDESMEAYAHCTLCPRACGADRISGARGFCGMPAHPVAARAAVHLWEEPAIAGDFGTGAHLFLRLHSGLRFLPERNHQPRRRGPACLHGAAAGNLPAAH